MFNRPGPFRAALITGATSGIGRTFAHELAPKLPVLATGRNEDKLDDLEAELQGRARKLNVVAADLATDEGRSALVEAAEAFGVDLFINNAGLGALGAFLDNPPERERTTLEVNVIAATMLTHALLPGMIERAKMHGSRAGLIVMSSSAGFVPTPYLATYAASKAYSLAFTEALASEVGDEPVDVLAVCPGAVKTAFGERAGFEGGSFPGAIPPEQVVEKALESLGVQRVVFTDMATSAAFTQIALLREAISRGLAFGIPGLRRLVDRFQ